MASSDSHTIRQVIELVLCVLVPPLAVFLHANDLCTIHMLISLVLWLCAIVPGIIHALWFCFYRDRSSAHYTAATPAVNA